MPEEKKENIKTNKVRLFIERAKNIKVFFWAFVVIFILILSFNNQENITIIELLIIAILGAFFLTSFLWVVFWLITQPYIVFSNNNKNIFEKILLMLAWAISLLMLIAVTVIPSLMQSDYPMMAKVSASKENHNLIHTMMADNLQKCSTGALKTITLSIGKSGKKKDYTCSSTTEQFVDTFVSYFNNNDWKNPHDAQQSCCANKHNNPSLKGTPNTHIYATSDTEIIIKTNIGTIDGDNKWLINKVTRTKYE
jgi:hypothetical protein